MNTVKTKTASSIGSGRYFHVEVRPKTDFNAFYTKDVGRTGHSLLVLGRKKKDGKWAAHLWLINKKDAYITESGKLDSEDRRVKQILDYVDGDLVHKEKDTFYVRSQRSLKKIPEEHPSCSRTDCPEMYFENYEDYEKYYESQLV